MRLSALLLLSLAACTGSGPVATTGPDAVPSGALLAAVTDSLAEAARRPEVARRAMIRAGITPLGDFGRPDSLNPQFLLGDRVAGLIPGRHPLARPDLVIVASGLDDPATPAVLEAMRVLVERSMWTIAPERTVLVALWPAGRAEEALRTEVWPRENVRAVLLVGEGGPTPTDIEVARILPGGDALGLAQSVLDETIRLAQRPAASDTLAAR